MKDALNLLDLEFVFTQRQLLGVSQFTNELKRRGVSFSISEQGHLEVLHKTQMLIPVFQVRKDIRGIKAAARRQNYPLGVALRASVSTRASDLRDDRDRGYLHDPRTTAFQPWATYTRMIDNDRIQTREFLYSHYQLLLGPDVRDVASKVRIRRDRLKRFRFSLKLTPFEREDIQHDVRYNDTLVVILSALESIYLPRIIGRVSSSHGEFEAWEQFETHFDPVAMLHWLEWTPEEILTAAERLLSRAHHVDPLANWIELTRLVRPDKWEQLRGDALVAMDYRIAAEMLLRFYEALVEAGEAAPPAPLPRYASHPRQERLGTKRAELDQVLTDFGISPHPSLVVFLEGETESLIVPRVMALLGIPTRRSLMEFHVVHGGASNIGKYALYIAPPSLGDSLGDAVQLTRPPTHFLFIVDYEDAFINPDEVARKKQHWVNMFATAIEQQYQMQVLLDDLEQLFEIRTWESGNFEFAHFTNAEIIQAIDQACHALGIVPARLLQEEEVEARRQNSQSKNIEKLWEKGQLGRAAKKRLTKLNVVEALWLILEQKIQLAIQENDIARIPVAKILRDAYYLALSVHRQHVIIRQVPSSNE